MPHRMTPSIPDYIRDLNPQQFLAATTTEGPVLVLSGAGTGKTRVLTTRIAYILQQKLAYSNQILAVTFTNKAAAEMKKRILNLTLDSNIDIPWIGTFHFLGVKILRRHAALLELNSNFTILDTDDSVRVAKQVLEMEQIDTKRWTGKAFISLIDEWKNRALTWDKVPDSESDTFAEGRGRTLYRQYQKRLKFLNACDFGDLILHPIELFQNHSEVLELYHTKFKYLLVDEYQDTNTAQYIWLRLLSKRTCGTLPNLCCVGDEDQSIYGWRGADIQNILKFETDFPNAKIIRLETNYRSTHHILGAASHLISHNVNRLGKTLKATHEDAKASLVKICSAWDSEEEAQKIGKTIETLSRSGHKLSQIAILVRASFQMRSFEERFVSVGLPYHVVGGPKFYERQEIRDALAYLKVAAHPGDDLAIERILNKPKRGIGPATSHLLHSFARKRHISLFESIQELLQTDEFKPKIQTTLQMFVSQVFRWHTQMSTLPPSELTEMILEDSGYLQSLKLVPNLETEGRLENLSELIRSLRGYESLIAFLEHIALTMELDRHKNSWDAVQIMTLHAAKGLEFDTVFLPGWEEGLFPHERSERSSESADAVEEERRLAYVGLTRARKNIYIWSVNNRRIHGRWQPSFPSRFLEELPEKHIQHKKSAQRYGRYSYSAGSSETFYPKPGWQRSSQNNFNRSDTYKASERNSDTPSLFKIGERVFHLKFGMGLITSIDGGRLSISFDKAGPRKVMQDFVEKILKS